VQTYRYIFNRLYAWNLRTWGESDMPQYNVCFWLSLVLVVNLLSIGALLGVNLRYASGTAVLVAYAAGFLAHYAYFIRTGRIHSLASEFAEAPSSVLQNGAVVLLYAFGSIVFFFGVVHLSSLTPAA
jgi:hypothetical protein